jgi:hypothetical protein
MEERDWLMVENATLAWNADVLEGQANQAKTREELLMRGWGFWERRARILEELGWVTGAWEWIARTVARRNYQATQPLSLERANPLLLERSKPEIVEVTPRPPSPPSPLHHIYFSFIPRHITPRLHIYHF